MIPIDTMNSLQQQIIEEQQRLKKVEDARKERLNQERKEQQQIEASQQRIAELQRAQAQAQFTEALRLNAEAVAANNQDVANLFGVLDGIQQAFAEGIPHYKAVEESFSQQQAVHNRALNAADGLLTPQPIVEDDRQYETQMRKAAREQRSYEAQITPALPLAFAVFKWVMQGKGKDEIRVRLGIGYAITGNQFTFDADHPLTDEALRAQLSAQYSRIRLP